jgi:hypothetical protein
MTKQVSTSELIKQWSIKYLLAALAGVLGYLSGFLIKEIGPPFLEKALPEISKTALLTICLLLLVFLLLASASCIYLWRQLSQKPKMKDYIFVKEIGVYKHRKTGDYVCGKCFSSGNHSPVAEVSTGLFCHVCETLYYTGGSGDVAIAGPTVFDDLDGHW